MDISKLLQSRYGELRTSQCELIQVHSMVGASGVISSRNRAYVKSLHLINIGYRRVQFSAVFLSDSSFVLAPVTQFRNGTRRSKNQQNNSVPPPSLLEAICKPPAVMMPHEKQQHREQYTPKKRSPSTNKLIADMSAPTVPA